MAKRARVACKSRHCSIGLVCRLRHKRDRTVFFATRITGERDAGGRQARKITEAILERLQI